MILLISEDDAYYSMSYCIECGAPAEICYCETKRVTRDEYVDAIKECKDLKMFLS